MKLPDSDTLLKLVVKSSSVGSTVKTVAEPSALFDSVPIPKIMEPVAVAAASLTDCISMMTPLLSVEKLTMGLMTCCARGTNEA